MNNLEFINQNIDDYKNHIIGLENKIIEDKKYPDFVKNYKERIEELKPILQQLKQIKVELEIMELIKNGWSSMEQTLSGEQIIKFGKLNLDDWLKVWKTLEKFALQKAVEIEDNE